MGTEKAQKGRVMMGEHNIVPNYFQQNQAEALDLVLTVDLDRPWTWPWIMPWTWPWILPWA